MIQKHFSTARAIFISMLSIFIFSCADIPTSIDLQPSLKSELNTPTLQSENKWTVTSQDFRVALYLIEISTGDDVAVLVNESKSSRKLIEGKLQAYWVANGLIVDNAKNSNASVKIELQKMLSKTEESTFSHKTTANIRIKVTLSNKLTSFSKTFKSRTYNEGAFSARIPTLNSNLNKQLSALLEQIVQDAELNTKFISLTKNK